MKVLYIVFILSLTWQNFLCQELVLHEGKLHAKGVEKTNFRDSNNLKQGLWLYSSNDGLVKSVWYVDDKLSDTVKIYQGKSLKLLHYEIYKNGLKNGKYVDYDVDGNIKLEMNYVNDTLNGICRKYYKGQLTERVNYEDGEKEGERKYISPNGEVLIENYHKGKLAGSFKRFYANCNIKREGDSNNFAPMKFYSKDGVLRKQYTYTKEGVHLKTTLFDRKGNIKKVVTVK